MWSVIARIMSSKKCKSWYAVTFILLMGLCVGAYGYVAIGSVKASGDITIKIGDASGSAGEDIEIPVFIENNNGFCNIGLEIKYNEKIFELKEVRNNSGVGGNYTSAQYISTNPYNMDWNSSDALTYNGELAVMVFKINDGASPGDYIISVDYYKGRSGDYEDGIDVNYDGDEKPLNLTYVNGIITVKDSGVITPTKRPKPTVTPTIIPKPTDAPEPTDTPEPTATPEPTVTNSPTDEPDDSVTPKPNADPTPTLAVIPSMVPDNNSVPNAALSVGALAESVPKSTEEPVNSNSIILPKVKINKLVNKGKGRVEMSLKVLSNRDKSQVTSYECQYSLNKKFKSKKTCSIKSAKKIIIKKLKRNKTYYFRVRTVGKNNKKGKWSSVKKLKIK